MRLALITDTAGGTHSEVLLEGDKSQLDYQLWQALRHDGPSEANQAYQALWARGQQYHAAPNGTQYELVNLEKRGYE